MIRNDRTLGMMVTRAKGGIEFGGQFAGNIL